MKRARDKLKSVAVIGGGITGLAAAHRLRELDPSLEVTALEAADRLGGVLHTERHGDYCIEQSAENFVTNLPWALDEDHELAECIRVATYPCRRSRRAWRKWAATCGLGELE